MFTTGRVKKVTIQTSNSYVEIETDGRIIQSSNSHIQIEDAGRIIVQSSNGVTVRIEEM